MKNLENNPMIEKAVEIMVNNPGIDFIEAVKQAKEHFERLSFEILGGTEKGKAIVSTACESYYNRINA